MRTWAAWGVVVLWLGLNPAPAAEPWADPKLPVADGLDYESGLTIDQGGGGTGQFEQLNVEGRGFQGARNLLQRPQPFGTLHVLEVHSDGRSVRLVADGAPAGSRPRAAGPLSMA